MSDSYEVLLGKYNRALTSITQLDQQNMLLEKQREELLEDTRVIEKNVRHLCTTILKKDRELQEKRADWYSLPLLDMILMSQKSLENYFPSLKITIEKLMKYNRERGEKIESLQMQIKELEMERKGEEKNENTEEREVSNQIEEQRKYLEKKTDQESQKSQNLNENLELVEEPDDDWGDEIVDYMDTTMNAEKMPVSVNEGPKLEISLGTHDAIKKKIKEQMEESQEKAEERIKQLTEMEKIVLRVIGDTGLSELSAIITAIKDTVEGEKKPSNSYIRAAIVNLRGKSKKESEENGKSSLLFGVQCPLPGSPNFFLYRLNECGKNVYRCMYGKEPAISEMVVLEKNHDNLYHGYGIKKTAMLLEQMECVKNMGSKVYYLTRNSEYTVKLSNRNRYISDIVLISGSGEEEKYIYIEYETGKTTEAAFLEKCSKIAKISANLFFVAATNQAAEKIINRIKKWISYITSESGQFPCEGTIRIRMSTYLQLRDGNSKYHIPWEYDKSISRPKFK